MPEMTSVKAVSQVAAVDSTTKFVDDADTVQKDESMVAHVSPAWFALNDTQVTEQTIKDFLAKPIVLASGNFSTTDTYSFLNNYSLPFSAFNAPQGVLWVQKVAGYFGIVMDMRLRLVVNANRFQQGRYCIGWVPLCGPTPTTSNFKNIAVNNMHMATLVQRTTVPHVEIDLSTQTSAELLLPFTSTQSFWPLNSVFGASDYSSLGYLNVYPYSPLVAPTGSTVAPYTLYISFENVRLFGASTPQSGLADQELSNKLNGPISGVASAFSRGFKEISNVPLLSSYALTASWISDRIARTAAIFGFSKPSQGDSIVKYQILNNPGHSHVDGDSDCRSLGLIAKPSTVPVKGLSGTEFDEMDFSYVCRKYAYFLTIDWTDVSTGLLASIPVTNLKSVIVGSVSNYPPISFVSNFFQLWRGSLKFRFKFVKTEFHSGRLAFSFQPQDEVVIAGSSQYLNRVIIDIREHTEFEVVVPYISRRAFIGAGSRTGVLNVEVVDALVAPASVSNAITILVELAGGDDVEFAVPRSFSVMPTIITPQSGLSEDKTVSLNIGNSMVDANSIAASAYAIGDKVTNFRAFLKRFSPIAPNSRVAASTSKLNGPQLVINVDSILALNTGVATYYHISDNVGLVASCYGMWGGGIRIKDVLSTNLTTTPAAIITANTVTAVGIALSSGIQSSMISQTAYTTGSLSHNTPQILQQVFNNNTLVVEIPQYTANLKRNVADAIILQNDAASTFNAQQTIGCTQMQLRITPPAGLGAPVTTNIDYDFHNIYRSLSDDADFSVFISIPPLAVVVTGVHNGIF
jgi:hypothetical protein